MLWILPALTSPILWAVSNIVDGKLLRNNIKSPATLVALTGVFQGLPFCFVLLIGAWQQLAWQELLLAIGAGVIGFTVYYPYFRAVQKEHPATAVLLWNLAPALIAVGAAYFLNERFGFWQYIAVAALVLSAVVISLPKKKRLASIPHAALFWMALASILLATEVLLQEALFRRVAFLPGLAVISLTSFLLGSLVMLFRSTVRREMKHVFKSGAGWLAGANQGVDLGAQVTNSLALSLGPATLVSALGALQPLVILAISGMFFRKKALGTPPTLVRACIATILAAIGLALIGTR